MTTDLETAEELPDSAETPDAAPEESKPESVPASEDSSASEIPDGERDGASNSEPQPEPEETSPSSKETPDPENPEEKDSVQKSAAPEQPPRGEKRKPEKPRVEVPEYVDLNDFQNKSLISLHAIAQDIGLRVAGVRSKHQLVFEILKFYGKHGSRIEAEGFLDYNGDAYGFLRWPALSFAPNVDDVYVSPGFIRKLELKPGHLVRAAVRPPKDREKFLSVEDIVSVEGIKADDWVTPPKFDDLTALFPDERIILEYADCESPSPRVVDLIAPLGKGQRGLIVAPPRGGKTILLKNIAVSIQKNHPEVELIVLLLDERPEEVTDFEETVDAAVYSSTFDESPKRHVQVADMVSERARRLVEQKKDVVILLDSLTRLARGHNSAVQGGKGGGRMGSGGLDTKALQRPRKFFGAARNVEEGGSLTILATCLIETDSRMDEVIFEEFKGTGNMEITLDRELAEKRVYPAIHSLKSGTRKDDLLYHPDELKRVTGIRKQMAQLPAGEAMETLVRNIQLTNSNAELLLRGLR